MAFKLPLSNVSVVWYWLWYHLAKHYDVNETFDKDIKSVDC